MVSFIFSILFFLFGVIFLLFSYSKKMYQKLVDTNNEKFANKANKHIRICGYILMVGSILLMLEIYF